MEPDVDLMDSTDNSGSNGSPPHPQAQVIDLLLTRKKVVGVSFLFLFILIMAVVEWSENLLSIKGGILVETTAISKPKLQKSNDDNDENSDEVPLRNYTKLPTTNLTTVVAKATSSTFGPTQTNMSTSKQPGPNLSTSEVSGAHISTTTPFQAKGENRIEQIKRGLESYNEAKYYIYESVNLTLPHIRKKAFNPKAHPTWGRQKWTHRFGGYAQGEIRYYQALEQPNHQLRTYNISEASIIIVPIPLGAAVFWGKKKDLEVAFQHLFHNEPYFEEYRDRHVYISTNERMFRNTPQNLRMFQKEGITKSIITNISSGILVNDIDPYFFNYARTKTQKFRYSDWGQPKGDFNFLFQYCWCIGYAHEVSSPVIELSNFQINTWKSKSLHYFYHSRDSGHYLMNSSIFRNAPVDPKVMDDLIQPSSVGRSISHDQWANDLLDSRFCIIIRGDNPASRQLYTSIRAGCIPVVISDILPMYHPIFRSFMNYGDFTIMLDETEFLNDPAGTLNTATNLSDEELEQKLRGLELLQRILAVDRPDSLFVEAFVREKVASQRKNYYNFDQILGGL